LPARCCQPAVAGGFVYADLRGEFSTHLAPQALFTQNSLVCEQLLQAFPFPNTLGEVTLHPLSQACCLFTAHMGIGSSPLSCSVFLPPPLSQAFPLLVAGHALPLRPCPLQPGLASLFTVGKDSPPSLFGTQGTPPSLLLVFIVLIAYYSVSLFSLGGGRSVQGTVLIWPRVVCGSTVYCLAHLVHIFPSHLGAGVWQPGGLPVFSI
jgi:hypothetical protein